MFVNLISLIKSDDFTYADKSEIYMKMSSHRVGEVPQIKWEVLEQT